MMDRDQAMDDRLEEFLAGRLDGAGRAALERELAVDAELRADLEFLRRVRNEAAALPRTLEPGRDLWPEIAARLDGARRGTVDFGRYRTRQRVPMMRYVVAAAAIALFAVALPLLVEPRPSGVGPVDVAGAAPESDPELERVTAQYLAARDELMAALAERKDKIAPETYAVVEENLTVIASAVSEIETALAIEPESEKLERMLYAAYRSEVNLLRQAVQLSEGPAASNGADDSKGDGDEV
jgi:hypothetical protein